MVMGIPLSVVSNQASFDLEKSLSLSCDRHCYNGLCLNGSCICSKGWVGIQCDHCYGRIQLTENQSQLIDGPLDYASSSKCTWVVENVKKSGTSLNIRLENFQTECGWDFVYIYDGDVDIIDVHITVTRMVYVVIVNVFVKKGLQVLTVKYEYAAYTMKESPDHACMVESVRIFDALVYHLTTSHLLWVSHASGCGFETSGINKINIPKIITSAASEVCQVQKKYSVWDRIATNRAPSGRASHASIIIDDVIWSVGGEHFNGVSFEDPVVFNITSRLWKTITVEGNFKPAPRFDHTLVRYKMKLFMFGGVIGRKNITSELWSFDLQTKKWTLEGGENNDVMLAPLSVAGHTAHVIGSEMLIFFGYHPEIGFVHNVQIFNFGNSPETRKWRFGNTKDQVYGRFRHSSVQYKMDTGDAILVYGGTMWSKSQNNLTDSLMKYDIKHEKWYVTNLSPSGVQLFLHTASILNGLMIVVGGSGYNISESRTKQECFSSMILVYDIACKQWFNISSGTAELRRYGHTAVVTNDELFIWGGFNGRMLNDVWQFSAEDLLHLTDALCDEPHTMRRANFTKDID
ncbi:kelch repeat protein [Dictyocaulus viviparus]|uniref:Kelch repeat protein n=1 Tax=Dictyocaulus viviparus TaxID=29172 RepID=A0A0D8XNA9_DICVI|nr:kelch repeat protein [Dictyocaulus viviparus]